MPPKKSVYLAELVLILVILATPINSNEEQILDYGSELLEDIFHKEAPSGIYISEKLIGTDELKYLDFVSKNLEGFEKIIESKKKYFFKNSDETDYFISIKNNERYFVEMDEFKIAVNVEGYFAKLDNIGIIVFKRTDIKEIVFATAIHESIHAIQYEEGIGEGTMYDILNIDVNEFDLKELYESLRWVERELDAHKRTADFLKKTLNSENSEEVLTFLNITEKQIRNAINKELYKYSLYEQEEKELINAIIEKSSISS